MRVPVAALAILLFPASPLPAAATSLLSAGEEWTLLSVPGRPVAEIVISDGRADIATKDAVRFAYRPMQQTSAGLAWRWRVRGDFPVSDMTEPGRDDRPLAIHLWLDSPAADDVLFGTLARLIGFPRVTHVLTYAWGGNLPPGTLLANPHYENGTILVLKSATTPDEGWLSETRDLARDLERAFGDGVSITDIRHIAISTDLDDLGGMASAGITDLRSSPSGE